MIRPRFLSRKLHARAICSSHRESLCKEHVGGRTLRKGLTLLEILLASVILAGALAALAQQNSTGVQAALRSQLETEAAVHCQSILNRLLVEGMPSREVIEQKLPQHDRWRWSARRIDSQFEGLSLLTVTVFQEGATRKISAFSLSRLVETDRQEPR